MPNFGDQTYMYPGQQMMPYTGAPSYMYPGQQMMPYTGAPSYMYPGQQMVPYTGAPYNMYSRQQMVPYTGAPTHMYPGQQMMPYTGALSYMYPGQQMVPYTGAPSYMYPGQQMMHYSGMPSQMDNPGYSMSRQTVYTAAMSAAEVGLSKLSDHLADLKVESLTKAKADEIRIKAENAVKEFLKAKGQLLDEIKALKVNPEKNKELIAELEKALAESEKTADRSKVLLDLIRQSDEALINAVKSGHLAKTAREIAALMSKTKKTVDNAHAALGSGVKTEQPGIVQINELKVLQGNMKFYMHDYVIGKGITEVEIKTGSQIPIRSMPIIIRASVEDDMKTRFRHLKESGVLPAGTTFNDVTDATDGHKFSYTNERIGTTTWVSKEEYKWEPDSLTKPKLTRLSQSNSDQSTEASTGDKVEIWTAVPAQNLGFNVTGKTISWKRRSLLYNKEKIEEQIPTNNEAKAYINFSVFLK